MDFLQVLTQRSLELQLTCMWMYMISLRLPLSWYYNDGCCGLLSEMNRLVVNLSVKSISLGD